MGDVTMVPHVSSRHSWASSRADPACDLVVLCDRHGLRSEIRDSRGERVLRVPAIALDGEGAGAKVAHLLGHLGRFQALGDLEYDTPSGSLAAGRCRFHVVEQGGKALKLSGATYEATDKQDLEVRFFNKGTASSVHVAIFSSTPRGVDGIYPEDGQAAAAVLMLIYCCCCC